MSSPGQPNPNSAITTTWSGGQISNQAGQQTIEEWLTDHCSELDGTTISGDVLTTGWVSGGVGHSETTNRRTGESDDHFKLRHQIAFLTSMVSSPPGSEGA